jgi:hypothetical protein
VLACLLAGLAGCPRRVPQKPVAVVAPEPPQQAKDVDAAVSDVATGGAWEENGQSGILRVVVRSGGRRNLRSDVVLQWLRWDDRSEQPVEVKSVPITELRRGGIMVTASRIDDEGGRTVVKLALANAVSGVAGEARVWPESVGRYRAKLKWANARD